MINQSEIINKRWRRVLSYGINEISQAWETKKPSGVHMVSIGPAVGNYFDWNLNAMTEFAKGMGFDGVELRASDTDKFDLGNYEAKGKVGVHLADKASWTKLWREDKVALVNRFNNLGNAAKYLGATNQAEYITVLKSQLDFATKIEAEYCVLHGSEIDFDQVLGLSQDQHDGSVRLAAIELIKALNEPRLLIENAPKHEAGFHLAKDFLYLSRATEASILIDTSHLQISLNNPAIFIRQIEEIAGTGKVKAIHLSESVPRSQPKTDSAIPFDFWEKRRLAQTLLIDDHLPVGKYLKRPVEIIDAARPEYIIHELKAEPFKELLKALLIQQAALCGFDV